MPESLAVSRLQIYHVCDADNYILFTLKYLIFFIFIIDSFKTFIYLEESM
jgi:hypothetical protein